MPILFSVLSFLNFSIALTFFARMQLPGVSKFTRFISSVLTLIILYTSQRFYINVSELSSKSRGISISSPNRLATFVHKFTLHIKNKIILFGVALFHFPPPLQELTSPSTHSLSQPSHVSPHSLSLSMQSVVSSLRPRP